MKSPKSPAMVERVELGRRIEHLGLDLVEAAQAVRHVPRDGVDGARLGEGAAVHGADHLERLGVARLRGGEVAVGGAQQVVGLAELVDQPDDLVGMLDQVGGEAGGDHQVDPLPRRLLEVHQPPGEAPLQQLGPRRPVEGEGDDVHLEAAGVAARRAGSRPASRRRRRRTGSGWRRRRCAASRAVIRPDWHPSSDLLRDAAPAPRPALRAGAARAPSCRALRGGPRSAAPPPGCRRSAARGGAAGTTSGTACRPPCGRGRSAAPAPARWEKATGSSTYSRLFRASRPLRRLLSPAGEGGRLGAALAHAGADLLEDLVDAEVLGRREAGAWVGHAKPILRPTAPRP